MKRARVTNNKNDFTRVKFTWKMTFFKKHPVCDFCFGWHFLVARQATIFHWETEFAFNFWFTLRSSTPWVNIVIKSSWITGPTIDFSFSETWEVVFTWRIKYYSKFFITFLFYLHDEAYSLFLHFLSYLSPMFNSNLFLKIEPIVRLPYIFYWFPMTLLVQKFRHIHLFKL